MNLDTLKAQRRWVCYKSATDKAPLNARTGKNAKSTDASTWSTYAEAVAGAKRHGFAGVGFVFTGDDGLVGIDLDDCLSGDEESPVRSKLAKHLMELSPSYTEFSPSLTGLHIIGTGLLESAIRATINGDKVEVYNRGRYFTYTGLHLEGTPLEFCDVQHAINEIIDLVAEERNESWTKPAPFAVATSSDDEHYAFVYQTWTDRAVSMMQMATKGNRHNTRVKAGRLLGGALESLSRVGYPVMSDDEAVRLLYNVLLPDSGEEKIEEKAIRNGIAYGKQAPLTIWERRQRVELPPPMEPYQETAMDLSDDVERMKRVYHLTDVGNGIRFADYYRGIVSYVIEWQQWMVWDGKRWQRTDAVEMRRLAHDLVLTMYKDAAADGVINQELSKWAMKSESAARINAMLDSAQPYLVVPASLFDAQHDVLNVANGMLNLVDGTVRPHDPLAYHTKLVDIEYDDAVSMEWWVNFMLIVFNEDVELIEYMQRAVGYTLTGRTDEHCLFFCYGTGKNGKSTFMRALEVLLGSYSTITSVEALLDASKQGEGATPYMAKLPGMRMAMAQEMPEGRRMNESLVKSITSSDSISARDMYKSVFTFSPTHKLWITGNHLPRISGTDDGIWRRLRIVPFTVTIPETKRKDSRVIEAELQHHIKGLLRWAVMGAMQWAKSGLKSCKAVERATLQYRGEEDAVQRFINDRCELSPVATVNKGKLFSEWQAWASDEGDRIMGYKTQRWLIRQLVGRFKCESGGDGRSSVVGIRLKPDDDIGNHLSS